MDDWYFIGLSPLSLALRKQVFMTLIEPQLDTLPKLKVVQGVKRWIDEGSLAKGDPLPSERSLSAQFKVARDTVRAALDELCREGLVGDSAGPGRRTRSVTRGSTPGVQNVLSNIIVVIGPERRSKPGTSVRGSLETISHGAQDQIDATGYHALVFNQSRLKESDLDHLLGQGVYGVVVTETSGQPTIAAGILERIAKQKVPMVVYGGIDTQAACDRVASDHEAGAYQLTQWLISQGRRKILMFWAWHHTQAWARARRAGYERAMREAGLEPMPEPNIILFNNPANETDPRIIFEARTRYFTGYLAPYLVGPNRIDALMAPNDGEAVMAASCCQLMGLQPRQDVLITGYDNTWADLQERTIQPIAPSATIDKQNEASGRELVQLLSDRAEGRLPADPQVRVQPPKLVIISQADQPSATP